MTRPVVAAATGATLVLLAACGAKDGDAIGSDDTPAKATPEALVAVALSHLTPEPDDIEFYRADDPVDDSGTLSPWIGGQLRWDPDPDWSLSIRVQPTPKEFEPCDGRSCADLGDAQLSWQEPGEDAPGYVTVYVVRDGELRSIGYEGYGVTGDPRDEDLPMDLDELAEIVTDPAFALTTTQGAVDAGEDVAELADDLRAEARREKQDRQDAMPPGTTPRSLAAYVADRLTAMDERTVITAGRARTFHEPAGKVLDGWGIELTLREGLRVHVTVIGARGPAINACQPTMTCWSERHRRLLAREGLAGIFREHEENSLHVWVEGEGVDPTSPRYFDTLPAADRSQEVVQAALVLVDDSSIGNRTTEEWIEAGEELGWFQD